MIDFFFKELFSSAVKAGIDKWKDSKEFRTIRLIAHETIYRELRWNLECLSCSNPEERSLYLKSLRIASFTSLTGMGAPIDEIFSAQIPTTSTLQEARTSKLLIRRVAEDKSLSQLLDRTYNRIEFLRLRISEGLPVGDISYLRSLVRLSIECTKDGRTGI